MGAATMLAPTAMPPPVTNNGRDKVSWSKEVWDRIDMAVHDEAMRTKVASKFLPIHPVAPRTTTVPSDLIVSPDGTLAVDEGATTRLIEIWVEFELTPQQLEHETGEQSEMGSSTAVTLATRAANIVSQAEDLLIFQGQNAINNANATSLFTTSVRHRGVPADTGLLDLPPSPPLPLAVQVIAVPLKDSTGGGVYGENTFNKVALGYSILQQNGQYGPYALVLQTTPYADTYAPLKDTLILTADRIKPLMTAGFYGTGTLTFVPKTPPPPPPPFYGVLVSLGGNTMDLVVGLDATTAFMQQDTDGNYRFRVLERFALRLKDTTAVIRLEFQ